MAKTQATLEFLIRYGWAILFVLILIGSLLYFGVFSKTAMFDEVIYDCGNRLVKGTEITKSFDKSSDWSLENGVYAYYFYGNKVQSNVELHEWILYAEAVGLDTKSGECKEIMRFKKYTEVRNYKIRKD